MISSKKDGDTALSYASEEGYIRIINFLAQRNETLSSTNKEILDGEMLHLVEAIEYIARK